MDETTISDVLEVNGISVDWVSKHIYWTDELRHSTEMADYDGGNRVQLNTGYLGKPRSLLADPVNGQVKYYSWDSLTRTCTITNFELFCQSYPGL